MYTPGDKVREVKIGGHQTYRPAFEADKMAFSARLKPSAEPKVTQSSYIFILCVLNIVREEQMVRIWLYVHVQVCVSLPIIVGARSMTVVLWKLIRYEFTNSYRGTLLALLGCQIIDSSTGVISCH